MEYKLYKNGRELLRDNKVIFSSKAFVEQFAVRDLAQKYEGVNTKNYAFKFVDGDSYLLVLRVGSRDTLLCGAERLATYAANVVADYHLDVDTCNGEEKLVKAYKSAYLSRLSGTIKQALFAGGCFWCMSKPYYEYDGILNVLSGYAGGSEVDPTYEEVKKGLTHHKETVMLEYDSAVISYKELLDIYFDTIDPFDEFGQFIDRGDNYTCAIFTDDDVERKIVADYINAIEAQFNRKVQVKVLGSQVFYKAEEYHQDYAIKNPEAMEQELATSGRLSHTSYKVNGKK